MRRLLCFVPWLTACVIGTAYADTTVVPYDFLPRTCPNYFHPPDDKGAPPDSVPTGVLGTPDFDVQTVRTNSLVLIVPGGGGVRGDYTLVKPIGFFYEDVARPVDDNTDCRCTAEGPDGYEDLVALFDPKDLAKALKHAHDGEQVPVCMDGDLLDETKIEGCDCIVVVREPLPVDENSWGRVKTTYR